MCRTSQHNIACFWKEDEEEEELTKRTPLNGSKIY